MIGQPVARFCEEFFHFVLADVIVFSQVENRNKHVQMLEQLGNRCRLLQLNREERAFAPLRELFIERIALAATA